MSYILEALKKAEHQREIGQVPRIDSEHEPAAAGLSSRWVMIVVLILLVNAGLLLVLFWPEGSTGVPEPVVMLPQPAAQVPAPPVPSEPIRQAVEIPPTITPVVPPVSSPPRPAPVQAPAPAQHARNLPVWPQIPAHIFQRLSGSLRLDVHVYSDQPRDRFVLINLQKYHEGEKLQEGPVLDEITVEGVVLSLQGQQFLVRAQ